MEDGVVDRNGKKSWRFLFLYFSTWIMILIQITQDQRYLIGLEFLSVQTTLSSNAMLYDKEKGNMWFPYS